MIQHKQTGLSKFADDCTVWKTDKSIQGVNKQLNKQLCQVTNWMEKWGFKINTYKTVYMIFNKKELFLLQFSLKTAIILLTAG